jgi:hypothetical protein
VGSQPAHWWRSGHWTVTYPVCTRLSGGTPGSLRREAHNGRSRIVAPDRQVCNESLGNGRIQRSTASDPNDRLMWQAIGQ